MEQSEIYDKLNMLGAKILTASKNELYLSMQYLDAALEKLDYRMDVSSENMGTDGTSIIFNPKYVTENYEKDRAFLNRAYLHILMHCLFRHIYNGKRRNIKYWDLSCDIAAEYVIDTMGCSAVAKRLSHDREYTYSKLKKNMRELNAEEIYEYLSELRVSGEEYERLVCEFKVDNHKMWSGSAKSKKTDDAQESDEEKNSDENSEKGSGKGSEENKDSGEENVVSSNSGSKNSDKENERDWEKIGRRTAENMKLNREKDDSSGTLEMYLKSIQQPKYNYKDFLRRFAVYEEIMKIDEDCFDYGFYNYGLQLYKNMPLIEPLEYKEEKGISEFVIAVDTSASCSGDKIKKFLSETVEILKNRDTFFEKVRIYILQCDREIQNAVVINTMSDFNVFFDGFTVKGGGGTDFRPVFGYIDELIKAGGLKNLRGLIYFTDGKGIYPEIPTAYETAFILDGDENEEDVPLWAYKLVL